MNTDSINSNFRQELVFSTATDNSVFLIFRKCAYEFFMKKTSQTDVKKFETQLFSNIFYQNF